MIREISLVSGKFSRESGRKIEELFESNFTYIDGQVVRHH